MSYMTVGGSWSRLTCTAHSSCQTNASIRLPSVLNLCQFSIHVETVYLQMNSFTIATWQCQESAYLNSLSTWSVTLTYWVYKRSINKKPSFPHKPTYACKFIAREKKNIVAKHYWRFQGLNFITVSHMLSYLKV